MAWAKLDSTTLGSVGDSITTSIFTTKKFIQVMANIFDSGTFSTVARFNGDTGTNYASRFSESGGADSIDVSNSIGLVGSRSYTAPVFTISYILDIPTEEKLCISFLVGQSTAGAGTAPIRDETVMKWVNTSDGITSITRLNQAGGDMAANSNLTVLGTN